MPSHPLFDITDRVALVTGSSRGLGKAFARGLVEAGATVVVNGRDADTVERTRAELAEVGPGRVLSSVFDVTQPAQIDDALGRVTEQVGTPDIVINNAGLQHRAPITEWTDEQWHRIVDGNLSSVFYLTRAVAGAMIERGSGKIIVTSSVQSKLARPTIAPYCATKGAITTFVQSLCAELAPRGIQVNALAPGYFDTELNQALVNDPEFTGWITKRTPAGRWGQVEELVGTLIWLASPASQFVNGQTVYVDGGMTAVV